MSIKCRLKKPHIRNFVVLEVNDDLRYCIPYEGNETNLIYFKGDMRQGKYPEYHRLSKHQTPEFLIRSVVVRKQDVRFMDFVNCKQNVRFLDFADRKPVEIDVSELYEIHEKTITEYLDEYLETIKEGTPIDCHP